MINTCNTLSNNSIVSVSENKRSFAINNNHSKKINKVKVDGCYITSGLKCDYLFEILDKNNKKTSIDLVYYVELKGSDISHGYKQLSATLQHCQHNHTSCIKKCYIVASKFPSAGTSSQTMKKKFYRLNNVQLFISSSKKIVSI